MSDHAIQTESGPTSAAVMDVVRRQWGFDTLRPVQAAAIDAGLQKRDSLVVMPTGGGKSLCYQVPPLVAGRTDVVVSPLIALMKDQVDGLRAAGYAAEALHSGLPPSERAAAEDRIRSGACRLIFVSPERLLTPFFMHLVREIGVRTFAIDEAHCISQWGHDFRAEYRQLATLKHRFPKASIHAFTATATERVRADICTQLSLRDPLTLVGDFDRPNLTYRIVPRVDPQEQATEVIRRHKDEAVIVYCLSRKQTEDLAAALRLKGIDAKPYHAGMSPEARRRTQDDFASERVNVITATVAFGMGIDRSNVRCIIHANLPKSVEHYQQETGRAGRDGLEAECVLLYSSADVQRWERLIFRDNEDHAAADPEMLAAARETKMALLRDMQRFAIRQQCRHRMLKTYFGQRYDGPNCEACDVCLGEVEGTEDATVPAQKILSCVARMGGGFGVLHTVAVLRGANTEMIQQRGHDQLSTYGLMDDAPEKVLKNWVMQLVDQELLARTPGDRPVLQLNDASWEVMRGQREVRFLEVKRTRVRRSRAEKESWVGVDQGLFEHLRRVRREEAAKRGVPAYVIFSDATLRDMARAKPQSAEDLKQVRGVGDVKIERFGELFLRAVADFQAGRVDGDYEDMPSPEE